LLGVLGGFLLLYGCVAIFPRSVSDKYRYDTSGRLTLENAIRSTFLQALLGAIVLIGAASTWQQLLGTSQEIKISRNTQITEQFSKASEDLGSDKVEVRLGAIYTLQRLTRTAEGEEGKQDSLTVYQLLAGYIKARSPWPVRPLDKDEKNRGVARYRPLEIQSLTKRAPDIQAALKVIGTRSKRLPKGSDYSAFLTDVDLRGVTLGDLDLRNADLRTAALDYADGRRGEGHKHPDLQGADLRQATLRCAQMQGVDFRSAKLQNADFRDADLRAFPRPLLPEGIQDDARLDGADLTGVKWNDATKWPVNFKPGDHPKMEKDDTILALMDGKVVVVDHPDVTIRDWVSDGTPRTEETVSSGTVIKRLDKGGMVTLKSQQQVSLPPGASLPLLRCSGQTLHPEIRPGATACPPRDDRECPSESAKMPDKSNIAQADK